ncbi:hypothetical protein PPYR_04587 [Photinus pyralis]|uniref:Cytochrome P450 n=3 Tax=Photinus pyralis TaxID=7054 RepID=A0A5N4AYG6_PHOPY|nr:hypothetical protein PPYR_04587 [Photinus pyralis]
MGESLTGSKSLGQICAEIYNAFPNHTYVGFYKSRTPGIVVRDYELIKDILIKDFKKFHDNDFYIDEKVDLIMGKNVFTLRGEQWKQTKSQLSRCFTSKKLKTMFPLMDEVGKAMITYLNNRQENNQLDGFDAKELASAFAVDLIASCTFGVAGHSFDSKKGELKKMVGEMFPQSTIIALKHVIFFVLPSLSSFIEVRVFPEKLTRYVRNMVTKTIRYRELNSIVYGDFLDIIREPIKDSRPFTEDDLTAHAGGFFGDGVETTSIATSYILYELAVHTDVQETLRQQIDDILSKHENKFDYDNILELEYLDNVLQETLRLHPPFPYMAKICTETIQWPSPLGLGKGPNVTLTKNMPIFIPVYGIQRDQKFYSDPNQFRPERFSTENKGINRPFLSFGSGPRRCLGERLGHIQVKIAIAYIVANFKITLNKKTILPLKIDPKYFLMAPKGGIHVNIVKRDEIK